MNSLIIILCILITAETEILLATNSFITIPQRNRESELESFSSSNPNKYATTTRTTTTTTPSSTKIQLYNPRSKKSLYNYYYNTDTGIQAQEEGYLNNVNTDQEALEERGSYSYIDNEGNAFQVSYIANEDGFQPKGSHLLTVPPLIKKALQYIAEHSERNGKE